MNLEEVRKNLHQQHWEDLVLFGREGLDELNDKIEGFKKQLSNDEGYNITQKIDGAPAVLIGHGLEGYPDICVGIKSFLTDPKNALSSIEEIEAKYSDRPGMATMLKYSLQLAKEIPSGEAWQGDCLFVKSTLKTREINGVNYITFQPNKIIYAFPEDSESYDKIINSDFGVAMHTRYTQTGDGWNQSFRIDPTSINVPSNIFLLSPALNYSKDEKDYSFEEVDKLYAKLQKLESALLANDDYENLVNNEAFMKYWNTFENANLADKGQVNLDVKSFYSDLVQYVKDKKAKEFDTKLSKLKTDKGKEKATANYNSEVEELDNILKNNKRVLILLVEALNTAANIKMLLLPGLTKNKPDYKSFLRRKSTGEYIDSDGEGISISDAKGNIVKLVDRSKFSNANRDPDIESGFDHNESLEEDYDFESTKKAIKQVCSEIKDEMSDHFTSIRFYSLYPKNVINLIIDCGSKPEVTVKRLKDLLRSKLADAGVSATVSIEEVKDDGSGFGPVYGEYEARIKFGTDEKHSKKLAALSDLDIEESLNEEFELDKRLVKLLGDKKDLFLKTIKKLILDNKENDVWPYGIYRPDEYASDELDAHDQPIQAKLDRVHNYWLDNFGLDTSKRGVSSLITAAMSNFKYELKHSDEYKKTLDYDDVNMLPPDEKFKIDLFYEWDAIQSDYFGDYDGDPGQGMSFEDWLRSELKDGVFNDREKVLVKDMLDEIEQGGNFYNFEEDFVKNMVNTVANTDKDPAVKATKEYHKMKTKKLKKGQMIVSSLSEDFSSFGDID